MPNRHKLLDRRAEFDILLAFLRKERFRMEEVMYLRILKKDLKRKKTMNTILLIFVILAATFIASSANNLITVSNALDNFFEKANAPDHWFASTNEDDVERFQTFAKENEYDYTVSRLIQIEPRNILPLRWLVR